jgi:DNA repair exonuclease SbcCD ATPase subunit
METVSDRSIVASLEAYASDLRSSGSFVEALAREYPSEVRSFGGTPELLRQIAEIQRLIDRSAGIVPVSEIQARLDELAELNRSISKELSEVGIAKAHLSDQSRILSPVDPRLQALVPEWLQSRLKLFWADIQRLEERESSLHAQLDRSLSQRRRWERELSRAREAESLVGKIEQLKAQVERLLAHVNARLAIQSREKSAGKSSPSGRLAARPSGYRSPAAEREAARAELLKWEQSWAGQRARFCGGCGRLLAGDGVCIHCSR